MVRATTAASQARAARIAGALYLITIATAMFAQAFVQASLTVRGDAARTARNILAHETLFRIGIASDLFAIAGTIPFPACYHLGMSLLPGATELPTIEAGPFKLRMIRPEDAADLFTIFGDGEVMRYWSTSVLKDLAAAEDLAKEIRDCFEQRSLFQWGLVRPEDDRVIGTTTLCNLDTQNRRAELGYALARSEWGKGVMGRVLPAIVSYGFETLDLHRIEADVDPRNPASIRLLERLGFQKEGYRRESYIVNGEIQDAVIYGLLKREYRAEG